MLTVGSSFQHRGSISDLTAPGSRFDGGLRSNLLSVGAPTSRTRTGAWSPS